MDILFVSYKMFKKYFESKLFLTQDPKIERKMSSLFYMLFNFFSNDLA